MQKIKTFIFIILSIMLIVGCDSDPGTGTNVSNNANQFDNTVLYGTWSLDGYQNICSQRAEMTA